MRGEQSAIDWLFRDRRTGRIVIGQSPNLALWIVIGAVLARLLLPWSSVQRIAGVVVVGGLVWWSVDEIARGVNPWRRILGGVVLAVVVLGVLGRR